MMARIQPEGQMPTPKHEIWKVPRHSYQKFQKTDKDVQHMIEESKIV